MVGFIRISDGGNGGKCIHIQYDLDDLDGKEVEAICLYCFEN
jgi:hypothetical protein